MNKFIIKIVGFGILVLLMNVFLGQCILYKRSIVKAKVYYPNMRWNDITNNKDQYDLIILGSSHAYRSLDPKVFDEKLGCNSYNMGSSSQGLITTSIILPTILKYQSPKYIVLEVFRGTLISTNRLVETCHNFDATTDFDLKLDLFKSLDLKDQLRAANVPVRLNYEKSVLFRNNVIEPKIIQGKKQEFYKGFVGTIISEDHKLNASLKKKEMNVQAFSKKNLEAIKTIKKICDQAGINFMIVTQPDHPLWIKSYVNYSELYAFLSSFCDSLEIPYFHLSTGNHLLGESDYYDNIHLTKKGAQKFSSFFIDECFNQFYKDNLSN